MTEDARFEDAGGRPLDLGAMDAEDCQVLSALVQDAVLTVGDVRWDRAGRQLALLVNRLRREEDTGQGAPERVRAVLLIENVMAVASQGIDRSERDTVLSLLSVSFEPADLPGGQVLLTLAGDGLLRAEVEALEMRLRDVTRPYRAPSGKRPDHAL